MILSLHSLETGLHGEITEGTDGDGGFVEAAALVWQEARRPSRRMYTSRKQIESRRFTTRPFFEAE